MHLENKRACTNISGMRLVASYVMGGIKISLGRFMKTPVLVSLPKLERVCDGLFMN